MGIFDFLTGGAQAKAAKDAARRIARSQAENRALAERFSTESLADIDAALAAALGETEAYSSAGTGALNALQGFLGLGDTGAAEGAINALMASPAYSFGLRESENALTRAMNARGRHYAGSTINAFGRNALDYASTQLGGLMNRIGGLADVGYSAAGQRSNQLLGAGGARADIRGNALGSIGGFNTGEANALAAGTLGEATARSNALSNLVNTAGNVGKFFLGSSLGGGNALSMLQNRALSGGTGGLY